MKITRAKFMTTVFVGRTNFGDTIDTTKKGEAEMTYDEDKQLLSVTYNGETGIIPLSAIAIMIPAAVEAPKRVVLPVKPVAAKPIKAQVSSPTGHVFEPGAGVTGQEFQGKK